jgi:hypothetical protein
MTTPKPVTAMFSQETVAEKYDQFCTRENAFCYKGERQWNKRTSCQKQAIVG